MRNFIEHVMWIVSVNGDECLFIERDGVERKESTREARGNFEGFEFESFYQVFFFSFIYIYFCLCLWFEGIIQVSR